jgi:hypothetical protein
MSSKPLDPNLASILDSIRATVGGESPPPAGPTPGPEPEPAGIEPAPAPAAVAKAPRKAAPVPPPQQTVEAFLAELIRPQVDAWLKAHLPEIVQKMAAEEIARLTGKK